MISLHGITSISTIPDKVAPILPSMPFSTGLTWRRMYVSTLTNAKFAGNPSHQQKNMESYLKLKSIMNHGRSSKLTCLVLGLLMMLTKSHTKYREYPSLTLQHIGLSYVPTLPNSPKILLFLVDQNWFARYPRPRLAIFDNGSEFSFEFLELLHSYGVTAKSTTVKNPKLTC
jgi:hypothetical protein